MSIFIQDREWCTINFKSIPGAELYLTYNVARGEKSSAARSSRPFPVVHPNQSPVSVASSVFSLAYEGEMLRAVLRTGKRQVALYPSSGRWFSPLVIIDQFINCIFQKKPYKDTLGTEGYFENDGGSERQGQWLSAQWGGIETGTPLRYEASRFLILVIYLICLMSLIMQDVLFTGHFRKAVEKCPPPATASCSASPTRPDTARSTTYCEFVWTSNPLEVTESERVCDGKHSHRKSVFTSVLRFAHAGQGEPFVSSSVSLSE